MDRPHPSEQEICTVKNKTSAGKSRRARSILRRPLARVIRPQQSRRLKAARIRVSHSIEATRWSRPGLTGLDTRLIDNICPGTNGTFIEFRANDGLQQSNTYALEREYGWTGVLIEPIAELAAECLRNRPFATIGLAELTAPDASGPQFRWKTQI